jgi:hypothetical protein
MSIPKRLGSWLVIILLLLLLAAAGFVANEGSRLGGAEVPASVYIAMALGVTFSLVLGFGLMALSFTAAGRAMPNLPC